jgi:hypothetical protein
MGEPVFDEARARTALDIAHDLETERPFRDRGIDQMPPQELSLRQGQWVIMNSPVGRYVILCDQEGRLCHFEIR